MTKGTFWITKRPDGRTSIGIEDYKVEFFDGMNHEMIYTFDTKNLLKLTEKLSESHQGTLAEMIEAEFGRHLDKKIMSLWMISNDIDYEFFSWTS